MKILIIPAFFQDSTRPTLGEFFLQQALALSRVGHSVSILYCDAYSIKKINSWMNYNEKTIYELYGIRIYRDKALCLAKHRIKGYKEKFAETIERLYKTNLSDEKFDVIHAHCAVWAGYAAYRLSQYTQIPYVITEHSTLFQLHKDWISEKDNRCIRRVYECASEVICVSNAFAGLLKEYRKDIKVVGNVVDCDFFCINNTKTNCKMRFLSVCYMHTKGQLEKKGIDILLSAWRKLSSRYDDIELVIGGGGKAKQVVDRWCNEYEIENTVVLLGELSRNEVREQMQKCDCFVLPSRYETFGVVFIEAMACGKPVIAIRNGGPDDFVNDRNGILLDTEDENRLVEAMESMIQNRFRFQQNQIREEIVCKYSQKAIAEQLEQIYQQIVNK